VLAGGLILIYTLGVAIFGVMAFALTCGFATSGTHGAKDNATLIGVVLVWPLVFLYVIFRTAFDAVFDRSTDR
jgi:ABC-type Na+ efflux pump permease subunit